MAASPSPITASGDTTVSAFINNLTPNTLYHFRVNGTNGSGASNGSDLTFNSYSNVTTLSSLTLSSGTLTPALTSGVTSYTVSVTADNSSITVTPVASDPNAQMTVNGGFIQPLSPFRTVNLNFGSNTITIKVTSSDQTATQSYTLTVTRQLSHDANLSALALSSGMLTPAFTPGNLSYASSVTCDATSISVVPTSENSDATITVNGTAVTSGGISGVIPLSPGSNTLLVKITAQDGTTQQTYTVNVTQLARTTGSLDPSFGTSGVVTTAIGTQSSGASSVAVQSDGKIIVAGSSGNGFSTGFFNLARYNANGSLDTSFGSAGTVSVSIGAGADVNRMVIQTDGKIVLAGYTGETDQNKFAVARFNTNGNLDTTFGGTGFVITPVGTISSWSNGLAVQADGKIVLSGLSSDNDSGETSSYALVRYNTDGSLDTSFGGTGKVTARFNTTEFDCGSQIVILNDGQILQSGHSVGAGIYAYSFSLVRYNTDGSLDTSFGSGGRVITSPNGNFELFDGDLILQPDGKAVLAGTVVWPGIVEQYALLRYNADGSLDNGFGNGGLVTTSFGNNVNCDRLALQSDGKILAGGIYIYHYGSASFALARYNADGSLDSSFGIGGTEIGYAANLSASSGALAIQPDGNLVMAGSYSNNGVYNFELLRFLGGSPNPQIGVSSPLGALLTNGATVSLPGVAVGSHGSQSFSITNTGMGTLNVSNVSVQGTNKADFSVTAQPSGSLGTGSSATLTVSFAPSSTALESASLLIPSNDPNNAVYTVNVTSWGLNSVQNWRQTWFQTTSNSGDAAEAACPAGDGVTNFMKYALGLNPLAPVSPAALTSVVSGSSNPLLSDRLSLSFTIPNPSPGDLTYAVQATSDLVKWTTVATMTGAQGWIWTVGGTSHIVETDGTTTSTLQVGDMVPTDGNPQRMMRLQVTGP